MNTSMHILMLIPDDPFNKLAHIFLTVNEASGRTDFFFPSQPRSVRSYKKTYYSAPRYHDNHSQSLMWCFGNLKKGRFGSLQPYWWITSWNGNVWAWSLKCTATCHERASMFSIWQADLAFTKQSSLVLEYMIGGSWSTFDWQRLLDVFVNSESRLERQGSL